MQAICTIGHSNRRIDVFVDLLGEYAVTHLADVRRFPGSKRNPQFGKDNFAASLVSGGIIYRHFEALGGRRKVHPSSPHGTWEVAGFRGYADYMDTAEFKDALEELKSWAKNTRAAILCAEASPFSCHRRLIADALVRDGFAVIHILDKGRSAEHALTDFARLEGTRIVYDGGTLQ